MAEIYSPKNYIQIYNAMEGYIVGSGSKLTNFNVGGRTRTLLEAFALVSGNTHYVFYQAFLAAIPVSLYEGFGFARLGGDSASGLVEFGLLETATGDTWYPSGIQIEAGGNKYSSSLLFVIFDGETKNGAVLPFEIDPIEISKQANYDASTNTPPIPAATPANKGHYYRVTVAGTPSAPAPAEIQVPLAVDDVIVSDGGLWRIGSGGIDVPTIADFPGEGANRSEGDIDSTTGVASFAGEDYGLDYFKATTDIVGGTEEESDSARKERFFVYVNGLTRTTPNGILSAALAVNGVQSATVLPLYPEPGFVTIFIDDGTASDNPALFSEVAKILKGDPNDKENFPGYIAAGITGSILPPERVDVEFFLLIYIDSNTKKQTIEIESLCEAAVADYLNALNMGNDVILTEITTACQNADPDVVDAEITGITVNAVPQVAPFANIAIDFDEISKSGGVTAASVIVDQQPPPGP